MQFRISEIEEAKEEEQEEATRADGQEELGRRGGGTQEVDERERNGECARVARLELRLSRNEGWRTENEDRNGRWGKDGGACGAYR